VDGAKCRLLQHLQETRGNGKSRPHNVSLISSPFHSLFDPILKS
jgi:hypothetical protein